MHTIIFKNKVFLVATGWNELSRRQLIEIAGVLHQEKDPVRQRASLLQILANMSWWIFLRIPAEKLAQLLPLADFIYRDNDLTRQLIAVRGRFYGPASDLDNFKIKEFVFSELYFSEFKETDSPEALSRLIAVLYRPARKRYNKKINPSGDIREPFNENLTARYAREIDRWPVEVRQAILIWYIGCRRAWVKQYDNVFSGGNDEDQAKYGLWSVMRTVAKQSVFGDIEKVQEQYVTSILMDLDETIEEARRLEKPKV